MRAPPASLLPLVAALALAAPRAARAQYEPVTDRDFALDLYQGAVLGTLRLVGMGGAGVALAEGSAGMVVNPAAPAVRPATSHDRWDWDAHLDWLTPELGSDFDNNGDPTTADESAQVITAGLVVQWEKWAIGGTFTSEGHSVALDADREAIASSTIGHFTLARSFLDDRWTLGAGFRSGVFTLAAGPTDSPQTLIDLAGISLETGVVWRPRETNLRVGGRLALPVSSGEAPPGGCDPMDCGGYILPERVSAPWEAAAGVAWRRAPTRWNQSIAGDFRDERALLLAADVVVSGAVDDGHGLEAYVHRQLQPSGRGTSVSVRAGGEYEWVPGRFRVRGGSYWEPGRFAGVGGRLHLTIGLELRVWSFCLLGDRYRVRLSLTGDGAEGYGNGGLSVGFWH